MHICQMALSGTYHYPGHKDLLTAKVLICDYLELLVNIKLVNQYFQQVLLKDNTMVMLVVNVAILVLKAMVLEVVSMAMMVQEMPQVMMVTQQSRPNQVVLREEQNQAITAWCMICMKICMNANSMKTQFCHKIIYDLKFHLCYGELL